MSNFEKNLKRLTLAGIGAAAKSIENLEDFFAGKDSERIDVLAQKGSEIIREGKESNSELIHKVGKSFDEFVEKYRNGKKIDISLLTAEERAELLEDLKNFKEKVEDKVEDIIEDINEEVNKEDK